MTCGSQRAVPSAGEQCPPLGSHIGTNKNTCFSSSTPDFSPPGGTIPLGGVTSCKCRMFMAFWKSRGSQGANSTCLSQAACLS